MLNTFSCTCPEDCPEGSGGTGAFSCDVSNVGTAGYQTGDLNLANLGDFLSCELEGDSTKLNCGGTCICTATCGKGSAGTCCGDQVCYSKGNSANYKCMDADEAGVADVAVEVDGECTAEMCSVDPCNGRCCQKDKSSGACVLKEQKAVA